MLTQTPPPEGMRIDLADYALVVQDLSKPVWHGPYQDSTTLSIYEAAVEIKEGSPLGYAETFAASVTYLTILIDGRDGAHSVTHGHYTRDTPVEAICQHLRDNVFDAYLEELAAKRKSSYVPGTETIQ